MEICFRSRSLLQQPCSVSEQTHRGPCMAKGEKGKGSGWRWPSHPTRRLDALEISAHMATELMNQQRFRGKVPHHPILRPLATFSQYSPLSMATVVAVTVMATGMRNSTIAPPIQTNETILMTSSSRCKPALSSDTRTDTPYQVDRPTVAVPASCYKVPVCASK